MKKLSALLALLGLLLVGDPALAQKGTPVFGLDKSGTTRALAIVDPTVGSYLPFGGIDTTSHTISLSAYGISGIGNTTGPTGDGAVNLFQNGSKTAYQIYSSVFPAGYYLWGTTRSVLDLEAGTTVQHGSAYDAYTYNANAQGANPNQKNVVGVFVQNVNAHALAASWGFNTACNDSTDNTAPQTYASTCNGWEADFFIANAGSIVQGAGFLMSGTAQPVGATGVTVGISSGSTAKWTAGFVTGDGAVTGGAISIGATATSGSNVPSQPVYWNYFNGGGTEVAVSLVAINGTLNISTTAINDNIGLQPTAGNANILAGGVSANINIGLFPKGVGIVQANGGFNATGALNGASGGVTGAWTAASLAATGTILSSGATSGVGYTTGAGGTVTQLTSRTTGVTINKVAGAITLFSAAGSGTPATFTVTNSAVAATDVIVISQKSGTDKYELFVTAVAAGSFNITFFTTGGTTVEQPVFNFVVIKGSAT